MIVAPTGQRTRRPARRTRITQVACRCFGSRSYEEVGLRDIATAARLDVGQIVREFGNKEKLFAAALSAALDTPVPVAGRRTSRLAGQVLSGTTAGIMQPCLMLAMSGASNAVGPIIRAEAPRLAARMQEFLRRGNAQPLRGATAMALVLGFTITGRVLSVVPVAGPAALVARRYLTAALSLVEGGRPYAKQPGRRRVSSTRAAVIAAADAEFSRAGYDQASIRSIARAAGVDPALALRQFGSKEALFQAALKSHFRPHYITPPWTVIRERFLKSLEAGWTPLDITLRSASSPVARPILRRDMEARFILPFADVLPAPHAALRASMAISVMLGIAFCRDVLAVEVLRTESAELQSYLGQFLDLVELEGEPFEIDSRAAGP